MRLCEETAPPLPSMELDSDPCIRRYRLDRPAYIASAVKSWRRNVWSRNGNNYNIESLKRARIARLDTMFGFTFVRTDLASRPTTLHATKRNRNTLVAHTYSGLHGHPTIGRRFFIVSDRQERLDIAICLLANAILGGRPIDDFENDKMQRNSLMLMSSVRPNASITFFQQPEPLMRQIELPLQPKYEPESAAEVEDQERAVGFRSHTPLGVGVKRFVDWYR